MIVAHLPSGYILAVAVLRHMPRIPVPVHAVFLAGIVGAVAPDFDMAYFHLIDHRQTHHHRYFTHWPVIWLMLAAVSFLWFRAGKSGGAFLALVFSLGGVLHLILDSFVGDIWWFAPWVDRPYAMFTVPARFKPWWLSFILHWSFAAELVICSWALFLYRRRSPPAATTGH